LFKNNIIAWAGIGQSKRGQPNKQARIGAVDYFPKRIEHVFLFSFQWQIKHVRHSAPSLINCSSRSFPVRAHFHFHLFSLFAYSLFDWDEEMCALKDNWGMREKN
jgi:hypothetical protein